MSQYAAFRFGRDAPSRIATTVVMFDEASELLPEETMHQPVIPFYPAISSGTDTGGSAFSQDWANIPGRVDLTFYQGDDVIVPLTVTDPSDPTYDVSTEVEWTAQIRTCHSYHSTLVNTFSIIDAYTPPDTEAGLSGFTEVTLFLARSENIYVGEYRWDLYSMSPLDVATFPQPPDVVAPEPWPPTDQIRTWLYGVVTILPRVTSTDILPLPDPVVVNWWPGPVGISASPDTYAVGPNGRVP